MDGSTGRRIPPIVMGHEAAGVVVACGADVTDTPPGTRVTVRCGPLWSEQDPSRAGPAFLEVEDDGPGIAPPDRARVFERFVRLSEDDRRGTGLGLAIVREIAIAHRATVEIVDGAGGRGTKVQVRFAA